MPVTLRYLFCRSGRLGLRQLGNVWNCQLSGEWSLIKHWSYPFKFPLLMFKLFSVFVRINKKQTLIMRVKCSEEVRSKLERWPLRKEEEVKRKILFAIKSGNFS